jgi:serine/threonine-protein kinase
MSAENRIISLVGVERLLERSAGVSVHAPGDLIANRYHLVRLIGTGGMGVVWEAHSDVLDIRVAIKLIHPTASNNEDQRRLIREAKAVARLSDPAVVRVFDCGETLDGEPYVVMELLAGQDLATRLEERGRLPPVEAVRTLLPIIRALGAAHDAGIVHRDVKPENVYLAQSATGQEQPKLLDFGIAKLDMPAERRLTQLGSALGSPCYMSPEQARGEDVDLRTDLWGACVVLYEAVTGRLPFDGDGYNAVMYAILSTDIPSFSQLSVDEPELWAIVARGLERDCALRWQTSAELVDALGQWLLARGVLHDLSGVSLHALPNRTNPGTTLTSVRPAKVTESVDHLAETSSSLPLALTRATESDRPRPFSRRCLRWFIAALATLASGAIGLVVWRVIQRPTDARVGSLPSAAATARPVQPPTPAVDATRPTVSAGSIAPASDAPLPARAEPRPSSRKPPSAPKGEAFKNPFD